MTTFRAIRTCALPAFLTLLGCSAEDTAQRTEALTFQSSAGLVSMEAEHFTANTPAGAHSWVQVSATNASGAEAMQANPNSGAILDTGYTTSSPRLDFVVHFAAAGTYSVWVRGRDTGSASGSNDSVHVGLNGQAVSTADRIGPFPTSLTWTRATQDNVNATIQVPSAGQHTVNVWMREDGFLLDKLVLATSSTYTPSGAGPAETPAAVTPTCTDGVQNGTETGVDCGGGCPACPPPGSNAIWLEAEAGVRSGSPGFAQQSSSAASGGQYLSAPSGTSANSAGASRVSFTFTAPAGTYKVWGRTIAPTLDDDSLWVSMDSGAFIKWNSIPNSTSWAWDDVHNSDSNGDVVTFALTAGSHTLVVANREDGIQLDKLYVTAAGDTPSGLGGGGASCSDGSQNQGETGVDCGGPCPACPTCGDATCNGGETCTSCPADCGACPPWTSQDIGAVGAAGSMSMSGGTMTLAGSGDDIHSTYGPQLDEFRFAYQALSGDVTLTARVASVTNTHEWAKAGVMIRESLNPDSRFALVYARPDRAVQAQFRAQTGQTGTDTGNPQGGTAAAKWLRIQRSGNQISTFYSTNGTSFTQIGSTTTMTLPTTVYVGFAVTSHNDGTLATGTFDSIVLSGGGPSCGDASCNGTETCSSCPADCGACNTCGNGSCASPETCSSCPADCGTCISCGDGACNGTETCSSCPADCGACISCGDGACNGTETCSTCPADCGACVVCGNGSCQSGESCSSCPADCGACPLWTSQDVGAVGAAGSMSISGSTMTLVGSGDDIHSTYGPQLDEFRFAYQALAGNVTLTARVASVTNTNEWAKGGLMIRESLSPDSRFGLVFVRPDRAVQAQFRTQTGQTGTDTGNPQGGTAAIKWLRIQRSGNQISTFYSTNGTSFTQIGSTTTMALPSTVYVGFAVTSHNDGQLCTATFDSIALSGQASCGDAACNGSETCSSCPADCGACAVCGDTACNGSETCSSCPADCGVCPAQPGLDSRPSNTTCLAVEPVAATARTAEVWPAAISFTNPIQVVQPPGDSSRLIVVQRSGQARSVPINATMSSQNTSFLQLSNVVTASNGGFLSMAFHPEWETNRYAYVLYTTANRMKRISRFQSTNGGQTLNASTEQVVLEIQHAIEFNHNGGQIAFGQDGYLYISSGDDAYLDYTRALLSAQTNTWFGKVLRIDVDSASPYAIPPGNPFAASSRPEVYAYGLRNPWRFSFDRMTGELWLADVGEQTWEEVNIIEPGAFYGWPHFEADDCGPAGCNSMPNTSPVYAYTLGAASISGGFVYRGTAIPSLQGKYVFGDHVTSEIWSYDRYTNIVEDIPGGAGGGVVGFGEDNAGELYAVLYTTGRILKVVPDTSGGPAEYPTLLTDTGCFGPTNATQVRTGLIPYDVAQEFWTDGASAERHFALPNGTQITVSSTGDYVLPPGAVATQTFTYQGQRIETRFLVRHPSGTYGAYTYEWNAAETQATLVPPEGKVRSLPGLEWQYLSRGQCFTCHSGTNDVHLGLHTKQLNFDSFYPTTGRTANQVDTLSYIGMLTGSTTSMAPFPAIDDASAPAAERALAYLSVNCSGCHQHNGGGAGPDFRSTTPWASKNLCLVPRNYPGVPTPSYLLNPGDHASSVFWVRATLRGPGAMPPLGTQLPDAVAAAELQQWIDGLTGCP